MNTEMNENSKRLRRRTSAELPLQRNRGTTQNQPVTRSEQLAEELKRMEAESKAATKQWTQWILTKEL
jgi:hypothetical protein